MGEALSSVAPTLSSASSVAFSSLTWVICKRTEFLYSIYGSSGPETEWQSDGEPHALGLSKEGSLFGYLHVPCRLSAS